MGSSVYERLDGIYCIQFIHVILFPMTSGVSEWASKQIFECSRARDWNERCTASGSCDWCERTSRRIREWASTLRVGFMVFQPKVGWVTTWRLRADQNGWVTERRLSLIKTLDNHHFDFFMDTVGYFPISFRAFSFIAYVHISPVLFWRMPEGLGRVVLVFDNDCEKNHQIIIWGIMLWFLSAFCNGWENLRPQLAGFSSRLREMTVAKLRRSQGMQDTRGLNFTQEKKWREISKKLRP